MLTHCSPLRGWLPSVTLGRRGLGWRIHESVEDTKLSTNKHHSLPPTSVTDGKTKHLSGVGFFYSFFLTVMEIYRGSLHERASDRENSALSCQRKEYSQLQEENSSCNETLSPKVFGV